MSRRGPRSYSKGAPSVPETRAEDDSTSSTSTRAKQTLPILPSGQDCSTNFAEPAHAGSSQCSSLVARSSEETSHLDQSSRGGSLHHPTRPLSSWPVQLTSMQSLLLEHYIERFSGSYTTCSGPENPFITVLLPLAMRNETVLKSLLALGGTQHWDTQDQQIEHEALWARQQTLEGCRKMIKNLEVTDGTSASSNRMVTADQEDMVLLLTSCQMLLVFEKMSGEGRSNWKPHLDFMAELLRRHLNLEYSFSHQIWEAFQFIRRCFSYSDLVAAIVQDVEPLSDLYLQPLRLPVLVTTSASSSNVEVPLHRSNVVLSRDYFPSLIARISSGDRSVTKADISKWDGRLDWLPSFSLTSISQFRNEYADRPHASLHPAQGLSYDSTNLDGHDEEHLIAEIYRAAADIYRQRKLYDSESLLSTSSTEAMALVQMLPRDSQFESTLPWPIGIIARELTADQVVERVQCLERLRLLEQRFRFKFLRRSQETIVKYWQQIDQVAATKQKRLVKLNRPSAVDMILLG